MTCLSLAHGGAFNNPKSIRQLWKEELSKVCIPLVIFAIPHEKNT